jgi:hypothetical protein
MLGRLQELGAMEQAQLATAVDAEQRPGGPTDARLPALPWRNVLFNGQAIAPSLLTDLRRLQLPHAGQVTLDYVSQMVRR